MKCFAALLLILLISTPAWADDLHNQLITPQFSRELVLPYWPILNGVGNENSFVCGGQDEVMAYRSIKELPYERVTPNSGEYNKGTYQITQLIDRCRMQGGCGGIEADQRSYFRAAPLVATNCYPHGKKTFLDDPVYENPPEPAGNPASPLNPNHPAWKQRNFISDENNFLYGRYLINQIGPIPTGTSTADAAIEGLELRFGEGSSGSYYSMNQSLPPHFLDAPYNWQLRAWFACPEIFKNGGYKQDPYFRILQRRMPAISYSRQPIGQEWLDYHKMLLDKVHGYLASQIVRGEFGLGPKTPVHAEGTELTVEEKEIRAILLNTWTILGEMKTKIEWRPCSGVYECLRGTLSRMYGAETVTIKECNDLADPAFIEYRHDTRFLRNEKMFCLSPEIARDCLSKKGNSPASYNVGDGCQPSHGQLRDGGIYEDAWPNPGYEIYDSGSLLVARQDNNAKAVAGYGPIEFSRLVHQMAHLYLGKDRMKGWPVDPDALREEEQAVMAAALVFGALVSMDNVPRDFFIQKNDFTRSVMTRGGTGEVMRATPGVRYSFPNECAGYEGIYLGPLCTDWYNIYLNLREWNPEVAWALANDFSNIPNFPYPPTMCINGTCGDFFIPMPAALDDAPAAAPPAGTGATTPPPTSGADLSVTGSAHFDPPTREEARAGLIYRIGYSINVVNNGPGRARGTMEVRVLLPVELTFVGAEPPYRGSSRYNESDHTVLLSFVGPLDSGATRNMIVRTEMRNLGPTDVEASVTNRNIRGPEEEDMNLANNTVIIRPALLTGGGTSSGAAESAAAPAGSVENGADLSVSGHAYFDPPTTEEERNGLLYRVNYGIDIVNNGPEQIDGLVVVSVPIPTALTYTSTEPPYEGSSSYHTNSRTVTFHLERLDAGSRRFMIVRTEMRQPGSVETDVSVSIGGETTIVDPVSGNNTLRIRPGYGGGP